MNKKVLRAANELEDVVLNIKTMIQDFRDPRMTIKEAYEQAYEIRRQLGYVVRGLDTRTEWD